MGRVVQWYKDLRIKSKLFLSYIPLIILPIVMVSTIAYSAFSFYFQNNVKEYNIQINDQANQNIESYLKYLDDLSAIIAYNSDVQTYLQRLSAMDITEKYHAEYKIEEFLINLTSFNSLISSAYIYVIDTQDIVRVNKVNDFSLDIFPSEKDWYRDFLSANSYKEFLLLKDANGQTDYCICRKIMDKTTQQPVAVVVLSSDVSTISELVDTFYFGPDGALRILDNNNELVYISNDYEDNADFQGVLTYEPQQVGSYIDKIDDHKLLISNSRSSYSGWSITCFVPVRYINRDIDQILRIMLLVGAASLLLLAAISSGIAKGIANPIVLLEMKMRRVKEGDLDTQIVVDCKDEVGRLSSEFNNMTKEIKELFTTVYQSQLSEREAELNALQAQINPHFLYNTLESIRTLASLNDDYDTSKMITALGKFLRLKISNKDRIIPISAEIEHAKSYIQLMGMKYTHIVFVVDIDPEIAHYQIVKLVLQPLLENAIDHGLKEKAYHGTIRITGRRQADLVVFEIADDGAGMSQDQLDALHRRIYGQGEAAPESASIGLCNVQTRLALSFGKEYGLHIESEENQGTTVRITIPILEL